MRCPLKGQGALALGFALENAAFALAATLLDLDLLKSADLSVLGESQDGVDALVG